MRFVRFPLRLPAEFAIAKFSSSMHQRFISGCLRLCPEFALREDSHNQFNGLIRAAADLLETGVGSGFQIDEFGAHAKTARQFAADVHRAKAQPVKVELFGAAKTYGELYAIPIHATDAVLEALANNVDRMFEHIVDALEAAARLECDGDPGGAVRPAVEEARQGFSQSVTNLYSTLAQEQGLALEKASSARLAEMLYAELTNPKEEKEQAAYAESLMRILAKGSEAWNLWRRLNPEARIDFRNTVAFREIDLWGYDLHDADFSGSALFGVDCYKTNFVGAKFIGVEIMRTTMVQCNLSGCDFSRTTLRDAHFPSSDLSGTVLRQADLTRANLSGAVLDGADLTGASLMGTTMVNTSLRGATLVDVVIHGIAAWDITTDEKTQQQNLIIGRDGFSVDNIEVAQFLNLLLHNEKISPMIDATTSKTILILGRFSPERKTVLDGLREGLRERGYLPILFDFDKPAARDLTETVSTLAHLARFVIADITDAKSIPQELQRIVPNMPSLPIQPVILASQYEYGMFKDFGGYLAVLPPYRYANIEELLASLDDKVIAPAVNRAKEIEQRRKAFEATLLQS
ncbi:MAG: pentapeptide repeat-containing protein [Chromatiales bacterium]